MLRKKAKITKDFDGTCCLKDLPNNVLFRFVKKDGSLSRKTYVKRKGCYDRRYKDYCVDCYDDINDFKNVKGNKKVSTKFTF